MSTLKTINVQHPSASSSNVTLDSSGNTSVAGNLSFNSGYGSAAVAYGCRAWVNFNGTGTVAIREDGNVSSITDNATGNYTVNFSTAMTDANYCTVVTGSNAYVGTPFTASAGGTDQTTSAVKILLVDVAGGAGDQPFVMVAIFR